MKAVKSLLIVPLVLALAACGAAPKKDNYVGLDAKQILTKGEASLKRGNYRQAILDFEGLEARFPFGQEAVKAQLGTIYAYYKNEEKESALAAADRFLHVHPTHPKADYVYYMKGLINFSQSYLFPNRYLPVDPAKTDPTSMQQAFADFLALTKRYPKSKYVADAQQRMIFLRNLLAKHELNVANFYMQRKAYLAAANRAAYIVEHYQKTAEVEPALKIMHDAYAHLGLKKLSQDALATLNKNFSVA